MSNENSKLLSTLASNVDSSTTSQSFSSCLTNTGEKNDLKEFKDAETELKEDSETELKDLLEEAYSYKTPGDKKNKSKKFLQLLHEVESETEDNGKFPQSLTRYGTASSQYHHSQSHGGHQKYGGSLQNLVDIDCSNHSLKGRRHFISLGGNQFSRTKKSSSSSVSTRQREGGSLPSNVNNTNLDLRKDQLKHNLLHEVTKTTNTITTTTTTKECLHNSDTNTHTTGSIGLLTSSSSFVNSMADTVIDMEVDNIDEDICSYISNYAKSKPQKKSNDTGKTEFVEMIEQKHLVDEKITFSSLDRSTNLETLNRGLPLDDNYKSCTSVLEKGNSNARRTTAIVTTASSLSNALTEGFTAASTGINVSSIGTVSLKQYDENGNLNMAGNSPNGISGNTSNTSNNSQSQAKAKSTKRQKEKNVRVFKAGDIPCNCGDQDINILVSFINNDSSSNENKNKKIKKKDKEKDGKSNPVIQKSSSLEELRSCTKLTADDNDNVTLRNKGIKNPKSGSKAGNSNNNVIRKGERRSWGTEEIPYYNELTTEDTKPKKKTSDTKINKKDVYGTEIPTKVHSMESINSEPSDFLLVTKKKKPKKRQTMDDSNFTSSNHNYSTRSGVFATNNSSNNNTNTTKKSGQNNEFQSYRKDNSNNSYDNSQSVNSQTGIPNQKSRRKSTSSMPPSDKSDLSDSDSVHSLPIESNKKSSQNTSIKQKNHHHQKNQPQSYAEITKRKKSQGNATIATTASTPTTTSTTTITTNDVGVNTSSTTILKEDSSSISSNIKTKPKTKHKPVIDFPELVPTSAPISTSNTTTPQISYSQSLVSPAAAAAAATVATTNNNNEALSATSPTSTTLSTNDCEFMQPKQMLHKSKSMDNESNSSSNSKHNNSQSSNNLLYNSIDQYPALEKTVKRSSNNNNNNNSTSGDSSTTTIINEQPKVSTSCAIDVKKKSTNTLFSSTSKKSKKLCPNTSMGNRNSNRPAVIIINDDPNRCETAKLSQFTFGDFKEDELKFLGTSEEPPFNMNSTLKSNQDINVSLESDNGYSSSLNQSAKTMNEEDTITTTDSQNSSSIRHININNTNNSSSKATNTVSLGNKMNKKIKTCSEIEDSLTSQVQIMPGSNAGLNFKFMENPADEDDEDEEYLEDEDDETNATTSTNIGDDDNDNANVNENNIEVDIRVINNNKSSCILSFKPPPTNILLPSHNDHIIDFIGSAWEEVIKSKVTLFLQK